VFDLSGKVALVTGATSGIGRQQAIALAKAGADIVALGRRTDRLDGTIAEIVKAGGQGKALCADLSLTDSLDDLAIQATKQFGSIDILCNTAGVNLRQHADDVTLDSWRQTLDLNLAIPFFLAQKLVPGMRDKGWGRIINIASLQSTRAFTNGIAYGASKGGISQLTRAMAEAWSGDGDNATIKSLAAKTAIGRNGELEDLDGVTVFLASNASDYITGQTIAVDGGFTAK